MLMNAQPRVVSTGLDTIVPIYRVDYANRRFFAVMDNNSNAWGDSQPVTTTGDDTWNEQMEELGRSESHPAHNLCGGYFHEQTASASIAARPIMVVNNYTTLVQGQSPMLKIYPTTQNQQHEVDTSRDMTYLRPRSVLLEPYPQWRASFARGSISELANSRVGLDDDVCQSHNQRDMEVFQPMSASLDPSHFAYPATISYSYEDGYATDLDPNPTIVAPSMLSLASVDSINKSLWMAPRQARIDDHRMYEHQDYHDGLPAFGVQFGLGQQYNDTLTAIDDIGELTHGSSVEDMSPSTISPKLLTLRSSNATLSSSEFHDEREGVQTESDATSTEDGSLYSGSDPECSEVVQKLQPTRVRRKLPSTASKVGRIKPDTVLDNNERLPATTSGRKPLPKSRLTKRNLSKQISANRSKPSTDKASKDSPKSSAHLQKHPKQIEPKPISSDMQEVPCIQSYTQTDTRQNPKDDFLVRSKLAGMSYKDIRRKGKFTEAESTLRGRFRTLTKHKNARVRKPEWDENDDRLLKKAVRKMAYGSDVAHCKVPWKQVAEYISKHGGSYHFGNATCRKRWDELQKAA
ncbi:hypothetical protein GLAREA_10810 [Glarea lozoyensis ATCC 20868]|uniref:Myb-like domain-containing protein n=1 Tax=Glarea lozoyensis (strain ATCC 20868 / MF5171) TaxID=1116229 RepID=S3DDD4_GLAL2|nr:uncharacterized protein GLAREA_10810 [Glarea lozoyensis ATCC 20868]EPE35114.1 hypothetical protein GLAREA_10810 [Glarea lozoyensis ATCC 20868]